MAEKKTGRKKAFDPEQEPERLHIIIPKKTRVALEIFAAQSELSRNEIINAAILDFIDRGKEEDKEA